MSKSIEHFTRHTEKLQCELGIMRGFGIALIILELYCCNLYIIWILMSLSLIASFMFTTRTESSSATNFAEDKLNSFHDVPATRYTCQQVMASLADVCILRSGVKC